jgi:hypothetical protein
MNTDLKNHALAGALAEMIAVTDGIHPAHAAARVQLAMEIASRMDSYLRPETVVNVATRLDGKPVSDATKQLALLLYRKLNEV